MTVVEASISPLSEESWVTASFNCIDGKGWIEYSPAMKCSESDDAVWENLCHQCGRCCFEKYEDDDGTIFFTATPCRYLDVVSRKCKVYERRFEINPDCIALTPQLVRSLNWLHDRCGYREALGITRRTANASDKKGENRN